ncbi:MAG: hypothetical protein MRY32_04870, partial [Rickettsiales bacterium]|nr:hypothetical protein [Rickettsiales bacterium]
MSEGSIGTSPDDSGTSRQHSPHHEVNPIVGLRRWIRQTITNRHEGSLKAALEEVLDEHDDSLESPISDEE